MSNRDTFVDESGSIFLVIDLLSHVFEDGYFVCALRINLFFHRSEYNSDNAVDLFAVVAVYIVLLPVKTTVATNYPEY